MQLSLVTGIAIPLPIQPLGNTPLVTYPATATVDAIFAPHATIHRCPTEEALNAHFAATGLLLPLLDQMALTTEWRSGFTGERQAAEGYLAALLGGHCKLLEASSDTDLAAMQKGLSTEGGLNQTLSKALSDCGTTQALEAGLDGFRSRLGLPTR